MALAPSGAQATNDALTVKNERKQLKKVKKAWIRGYDSFLRKDSNVQCLFSCAEHLILYHPDLPLTLSDKLELWGMRQQLYEGDCPFEWGAAAVVDPKLNAWIQNRGRTPDAAAWAFIRKVASLENTFPFLGDKTMQRPNSPWPKQIDDDKKPRTPAFTLWEDLPYSLKEQTNAARVVQFYARWKFVARKAIELTLTKKEAAKNLRYVSRMLLQKSGTSSDTAVAKLDELNTKADLFGEKMLEGVELMHYYDKFGKPRKGLLKYDAAKQLMWCCPDSSANRRAREAPKVAVDGAGLYVQDIAEVRAGRHSYVFKKSESRARVEPSLCLSLIGSSTTLDMEVKSRDIRDNLTMNIEDFISAKISAAKRARNQYESSFLYFTKDSASNVGRKRATRRKNLSFTESIQVKGVRDELLINGLPVLKVSRTGVKEPRMLWLIDPAKNIDERGQVDITTVPEMAASLERMRIVVTRRRANFTKHRARQNALLECEKGIDIADISEVRPGIAAHNFNVMKNKALRDLVDLGGDQDLKERCLSIVGSERTMCLEMDGGNAVATRDRILGGLKLLMHVSPKPLGKCTPQTIINAHAGREVIVVSNRLEFLLTSRNEQDEDEKLILKRGREVAQRLREMDASDQDPSEGVDEAGKPKKFTQAQILEWSRIFESFDEDGSGEIDPEELQNALNELGRRTSLSEAVEMIAKYDDDDSMTIGLDEFIDLMSNAGSEEAEFMRKVCRYFDAFDTDGGGTLSHEEFSRVLGKFGAKETEDTSSLLTDEEISRVIKIVDMDGDGEIDGNEFSNMLASVITG